MCQELTLVTAPCQTNEKHSDSLDVLDVLPVFQLPLWIFGGGCEGGGAITLGVGSYTEHSIVMLEAQYKFLCIGAVIS